MTYPKVSIIILTLFLFKKRKPVLKEIMMEDKFKLENVK